MKSYYLSIFFILTTFVITLKASTINQINDKYKIDGGGYKVWLDEVNGYNKTDPVNGYAGIIGEPITSLRVTGGKKYRVHVLGGKWLPPVTGNDQSEVENGYAGMLNGQSIDAVVIGGGVKYTVHLLGGDWLPPVSGYNLTDPKNGYAGIFGEPIDAIMVKNRTYAVSYTDMTIDTELCSIQGGTCMNPSSCGGILLTGLCPGGESNKCCIPNIERIDLNNNLNSHSNNNSQNTAYVIIIIILSILIIIAVFFYFRNVIFKYKNSDSSLIINSSNIIIEDPLPTYHENINEDIVDESSNMIVLGPFDDKKFGHSQIKKE